PGGRARAGDHRDLVEHDRRVLDEAAVGETLVGVDPLHAQAQVRERALVGGVLGHGPRVVDGLALEEGQLAARDGGGDAASEGDAHGGGRDRITMAVSDSREVAPMAPASAPVAELRKAVGLAQGGDWQAAHLIAQDYEGDPRANWIHAVVHRMEG